MRDENDSEFAELLRSADSDARISRDNLSRGVFEKKRSREMAATRLLTLGCSIGMLILLVGFWERETESGENISRSENVSVASNDVWPDENSMDSRLDELGIGQSLGRQSLEPMEEQIEELRQKIKQLGNIRLRQQEMIARERLSRTELSKIEFVLNWGY